MVETKATKKVALEKQKKSIANNEPTRHRLQLDFSPEAFEKIEALKNKADVRSNGELVRNSLRLYEWFIEQLRNNHKILVAKEDGVKEVEFFF